MLKTLAKLPVHFYKACISPFFPPSCRFTPTCSTYALDAIEKHGAGKGSWLAIKRIIKCGPWHHGPFHDPVPEKDATNPSQTRK